MLANALNTNEIKNSSGTEVEFQRISTSDRQTVFAAIAETPVAPHRLTVSHQESGSGLKKRRRSVIRIDLTSVSGVDNVTPITTSAYTVLDLPVGASSTTAVAANALAELMSFLASLGASTTILYDCTGNGAVTLLSGGL
jgi:hypothetical protein